MTTQSAKASQTARVWSVRRRLQDLRQDPSPLMNSHRRMQHLFWPDSQGLRSTKFFWCLLKLCLFLLFILLKWWRRCKGPRPSRSNGPSLAESYLRSCVSRWYTATTRHPTIHGLSLSWQPWLSLAQYQVKTNCLRHTANSSSRQPWLSLSCKALTTRKCSIFVFPAAILAFRQWYHSPDKSQVACVCKALWPTSCIAWCLPGTSEVDLWHSSKLCSVSQMNVVHAVHAGLPTSSVVEIQPKGPQRVCFLEMHMLGMSISFHTLAGRRREQKPRRWGSVRLSEFHGIPSKTVEIRKDWANLGLIRTGGTGTTLSWPWMRLLTRLEWFCSLPGTEFYKDGLTLITRWRSPWEIESRRQRERWVDVNRAVVWTVYWYTVSYYYIILL